MNPRSCTSIALWCAFCGALGGGCASNPLPTYDNADPAFIREHLTAQHAARSFRANGEAIVTDSDGDSATCDCVLLSRGRDHVRLRAWKFGQPVLDITLTPEGLWLMTGEERPVGSDDGLGGLTASSFARAWELISGRFFDGAPYAIDSFSQATIVAHRPMGDATVTCTIDAATLTPLEYLVQDRSGAQVARVELSRYRLVGTRAAATRINASGPGGAILIVLDDVEFDIELPASAFTPPARAVRQP